MRPKRNVMTELKPLHDQVLVLPDVRKETSGGVVIPHSAKDDGRAQRGTVLAVGPGRGGADGYTMPEDLRPNAVVLFRPFAGQLVRMADGTDARLMPALEVLAIQHTN